MHIQNMLKADRAKAIAVSPQLTLGEIIEKCEAIAAKGYKTHDGGEPSVCFDFEYFKPSHLDSWRGSYDELALCFVDRGDQVPLSGFIHMLKDANGKVFTGYKGGDYTMSTQTPVWVANYGNAGNTAIVGVLDKDYEVILQTAYCEFLPTP